MKLILLALILVFSGCNSSIICPSYPKPSQLVLTKIRDINNSSVDSWMSDQYKLNKKLKECKRW